MEKLFQQFTRKISNTSANFRRYLYDDINWKDRLIAIKGSRGVGKTLILQHIKLNRNLFVDITGLDMIDSVEYEWTVTEHISPDRIIDIRDGVYWDISQSPKLNYSKNTHL